MSDGRAPPGDSLGAKGGTASSGRLLAIGDIHGCYTALAALSERVQFSRDDQLVTLGDYVDRGPNSRAVVDWLIARHAAGGLVALRGNHDLMMLAARDSPAQAALWLDYGGDATLASYTSDRDGGFDAVPAEHWQFLEHACVDFFETQSHIFVHATLDPLLPLDEQTSASLFWEKLIDPEPHCSGKTLICGHTAQKSGRPRNYGHTICLDTWVYGDGWLTCLEVASGRYWQGNERGETREGRLEPPD